MTIEERLTRRTYCREDESRKTRKNLIRFKRIRLVMITR